MDDFTKFGIDINHIASSKKAIMKQMADVTKDIFDAFVEVGFTEKQALALTMGLMDSIQAKTTK